MKKSFLLFSALILLSFGCSSHPKNPEIDNLPNTEEELVFALPFAPVSYPVFKMLEDRVFEKNGIDTRLILWNTPDQLKALIIGEQADFFAVPSNTAASFYNKGVDVRLLNISIWRLLWIVSRDEGRNTLADYKGEKIAMPFKGDMPHIVFAEIARAQGLDQEKDFSLVFEATPMDVAQKLIMRRVNHAVLVDPMASMILMKTKSGPAGIIAPDLFRSVDLQEEWAGAFGGGSELPFAGMMAGASVLSDSSLIASFSAAYDEAARWCMEHPDETAKLAVKYIPQLKEKGVAEAMRHVQLKAVNAVDAQKELEDFYQVLLNSKPALVGGKLPDQEFYYHP